VQKTTSRLYWGHLWQDFDPMTYRLETAYGALQGKRDGEVIAFLGVPFARPPIAQLRFRSPEPCEPWVGVREATEIGASAPQLQSPLYAGLTHAEDCLSLNVWTPSIGGGKRPVMLWIHGGAFVGGSGGEAAYNGAILSRRADVVVVTINYRLGALGFAHVADVLGVDADTNIGLRDQLMALSWVRDHIDRLGGDPNNITLFGQSAGAMSVAALMSAPSARGMFRRAIVQSGSAHMVTTRDEASRMAEVLLAELKIDRHNATELWRRPYKDIVRAQRKCLELSVKRGTAGAMQDVREMTLIPFGDGNLLPVDPYAAIVAGAARDVDLMVGVTSDEWNFWLYLVDQAKLGIDEATLHKLVDRRSSGFGDRLVKSYRATELASAPAGNVFAAIESDRVFTVPAIRLAEAQSPHRRAVHMYTFDWRSSAFDGKFGSPHAIELSFVFGNFETPAGAAFVGESDAAVLLAGHMMDAWSDFARDGTAAWSGVGEWPRYDTGRRSTLWIAEQSHLVNDPRADRRRAWDGIQ